MSDEQFSLTTRIACPAAEVFAWHERAGALARLCPPWETVEVVAASGGVADGARVTVRSKVGPWWTTWEVEHRDYVAGRQFRDVQLSGPFARWEHLHRIEPDGPEACRLTDEIVYRLPGGAFGRALGAGFARQKIARLFNWRHAITRADCERVARRGPPVQKRVLLAGASGLLGRALETYLTTQGYAVARLVRRAPRGDREFFWDPAKGDLADAALEGIDAVVNLAGANVAEGRWTAARREAILSSRIAATATLVRAMARRERRPGVFVSASASGIFGDRGAEVLTEHSGLGRGFLADVCRAWETEARAAEGLGVRTVCARFGVVLTPAGGALAKLLPVFKLGLGGQIGRGEAWMSWVAIDDAIAAIEHAIATPGLTGAMNVVSPEPVTNATFTRELARVVHRPALCTVPVVVMRLVFGQMAEETLLASARLQPERLRASGFEFRTPGLAAALAMILGRSE